MHTLLGATAANAVDSGSGIFSPTQGSYDGGMTFLNRTDSFKNGSKNMILMGNPTNSSNLFFSNAAEAAINADSQQSINSIELGGDSANQDPLTPPANGS